ncbi:dual specificity protein phosphatase 3-like [Ruditapes philippinarum]|uniref:dual specificity protein phosphatase 3-like n=1 Tax=Ruditapes philippinarum TaxID=129788 RepID=UPI00295A8AE2|nr:dual specificity protein phosphatase 3-like [Ruditapes philippinarum]XP_060603776.1 dual specificity protein phosphatase 3-like [Ruditapes philippinarum]
MTTCKEVKDYLVSQNVHVEKLDEEQVTPGSQQNIWMTLMTTPEDPYNEVYPSLFLGDYTIAKKPEKLKAIGVTHVVNCACGSTFNMVNTDQEFFEESGILFHGIPAVDVWKFKMAPYFLAAANFIKQALDSGGKVYVHCMSGVSRSSAIILAFLIMMRDMPLMDAVKTVRDKRRILPNDGFLKELVELNNTLYST